MSSYLTPEQHAKLLEGINAGRVGKDRNNRSHVEAYEIRAHLNRIFGFGRWSQRVTAMEQIFEHVDGNRVTVAYRAQVQLDVYAEDGTPLAVYSEWATGDAPNFPMTSRADAHDFAIKTAESQGLKRCAMNLGDQFGLSLYKGGSLSPLVFKTLVAPEGAAATTARTADAPKIDAHVTESVPESEQAEDKRETNDKPAPPPPPGPPENSAKVEKWLRTLLVGPSADEPVAPFFARLQVAAAKGKFLTALVEDRDNNLVPANVLLNREQKRAQQERAA